MQYIDMFKSIAQSPTVLLPLVIFVLAVIFRVKLKDAIIGSLTVGVGYAGLKMVVKYLTTALGPAAEAMVKHYNLKMDVLDIGFGAMGATAWAGGGNTYMVPLFVLTILATNLILFFILRRTNTLSVDFWNYHHIMLIASLVFLVTDSKWAACFCAFTGALIGFKLSDWASPFISRYFGIQGVTTPAYSALTGILFIPINSIINVIPGIKNWNFNMETIRRRFGILGDTTVLGFLLGIVVGILAHYNGLKSFEMGISMAAVMILLPKMTHLFVDGLRPISNQVRSICEKRLKGRKILIGLDPSILVGNDAVITVSLLLIPITLILAVIIPGNKVLPFADLGAIIFKMALIVAFCRGNMFRSLVVGIIFTAVSLLCATSSAPLVSQAVHAANLAEGNEGAVASLTGPAMPLSYILLKSFTADSFAPYWYIGMAILLVVFLIIWYVVETRYISPKGEFIERRKKHHHTTPSKNPTNA